MPYGLYFEMLPGLVNIRDLSNSNKKTNLKVKVKEISL